MENKLADQLRTSLKKITNASRVDASVIKETVRDIQRALIQSDVNVKQVLALSKQIEQRALTEKPPAGMDSRRHVLNIIHQELLTIVGTSRKLALRKQTILMTGLYGQGKTTTTGKLGRYYKSKGMNVGVIAADVHRPAAYQQLRQLAERVGLQFYGEDGNTNAPDIVRNGLNQLRKKCDIVIIDTAGRDKLEDSLISELKEVYDIAKPDEKFLVMDAAVGQQAESQARAFHDAVTITGVIISKMDGTAKGGGALSAVALTKAPVVAIGVGEGMADLEAFDPEAFINELLGMGDLKALLAKSQEALSSSDKRSAQRMMQGKFGLDDLVTQLEGMQKMGGLAKLGMMMPGAKVSKDADTDMAERTKTYRIIIQSMTPEEIADPSLMKSSRIHRVARGSGTHTNMVRNLLAHHKQMKTGLKAMKGNRKMQQQLRRQMRG